jgi:hypothetical protein
MAADAADIIFVRELINEIDETGGWTDERITTFIDRYPKKNLFLSAADIWIVKAGSFSSAVDVSESGSSRKLSSLMTNALAMAKYYRDQGNGQEAQDPLKSAPFTVAIVRK